MHAASEPTAIARALRPVAVVCLVVLSLAAIVAQTPAQTDRERADAAARRTAERLRTLQREADSLAAQERTLLVDLRKLEVDRQIAVENLGRIERDLKATQGKLDAAEARAAELARAAAEQLPDVEARLVQLYKMGRAGYWRLLLNVEDLQALGRAYRTASALTAIDRARVTEHYATLDALARERKTLHTRATELESLKAEASKARQSLDRAVKSRVTLVEAIDQRRDLNAQLIGDLQSAQLKLQASIAQIEAGREAGALPLRPFQGDLPWPAAGRIVRQFGRQSSSRFGTTVARNGVDIEMAEGQPVRSVHEGTVAYADQFAGYGNLVILDHGNRAYSLYGFLESMDVARGGRVEAGKPLGTSGRDPSGNPALYFELRVDGTAVDPLQWLKKQP
jgi:septal ring factor EnvC (AmiA/AmiB activator)